MKTNWDYTKLAKSYLKRPDYSEEALDEMIRIAGVNKDSKICDIGAGVAHLTLPLLERGFDVIAIEPNDAMREIGAKRTRKYKTVWVEGTGEKTRQKSGTFDLVTFGSSFNVTDRSKALVETARILKKDGWFACMWNHRDIHNAVQKKIEDIIKKHIPNYNYGSRREDQTKIINESKLFRKVKKIEGNIFHEQTIKECVEAWKSHATLARQAKEKFPLVIREVEKYLKSIEVSSIKIPYTTRIWVAQKK